LNSCCRNSIGGALVSQARQFTNHPPQRMPRAARIAAIKCRLKRDSD